MDYLALSKIFFTLAFISVIVAMVSETKGRIFFTAIMVFIISLCLSASFLAVIKNYEEVNFMIFEIEDGYHLQCDKDEDLRKIAEVLPEIPEEELAKMDFETLSLQKSVDWKVNALAKEIEKTTKEIPGRIDAGFKQVKEISRDEIERAITEYVSRDKGDGLLANVSGVKVWPEAVIPDATGDDGRIKSVWKILLYSFFVLMTVVNALFICQYCVNRIFWKRMVNLRQRVAERAVEVYGYKPGGIWFNRRVDEFQKILQDEKISSAWYLSFLILNFQVMPVTCFFVKRDFPEIYSLKSFYLRLLEEMERVESLNKQAKENGKKIECEHPVWESFFLNGEKVLSFVFINKINNENDEILLPRHIIHNAIKIAKGDYVLAGAMSEISETYLISVADTNQIIFFVCGGNKTFDRVTIDVCEIEKFM